MNKTNSTIQHKLMRIVLVTSGVVIFFTCAAFIVYQFFSFKQNAKTQLSTLGEIVAANSTAALAFEDHKAAIEILNALKAEKHIVAACLYDTSGNVFATYPDSLARNALPLNPTQEKYSYSGTILQGYQKVIQGNIWVGTLYLKSDLKSIYQTLVRYALIGFIIFIFAISVAYILSTRLQKRVSEPILSLSKTAATVSGAKDYSVRAKKFDDDELGLLTDAFNNMLDQIERQNEEITSFSHGLEQKVNQRTAELERANTELKLQTEFVEAIIDSSVDIIAVFDKNLNYLLLNKQAREAYHVNLEDVLHKNILTVFPQIEHAQMYKDLKKALAGETVHNPHYKSAVSNSILENFFVPLLDKNNKVHSVLAIGHDITPIIEVNEKLKSLNTSLEHSNRDLEQFAYVASHDLQEPLRKIQIFSTQLANSLDDKEASKNHLQKIISSATRMSGLIKGVLNYSRLANDKTEFEEVSLNDLVRTIVADFELVISEKQAEVKTDQLPNLSGNRLQLNQLFSNLLSNSLKFNERKPAITISCTIIDGKDIEPFEGLKENMQYAYLVFKDNGIGFSQEHAHNIFNVFQRLHKKQDYPGTGIGLALCKKIVINHSGHIYVNSKLGEGTTFFIYLPLHHTMASAAADVGLR